jgi:hypothetical protein
MRARSVSPFDLGQHAFDITQGIVMLCCRRAEKQVKPILSLHFSLWLQEDSMEEVARAAGFSRQELYHSKNLSGKDRIELCAKSIHFKGVRRFGEALVLIIATSFSVTARTAFLPNTSRLRTRLCNGIAV